MTRDVSKGRKNINTTTTQQLHNTDFSIVPVYMALTQGIETHMQHVHVRLIVFTNMQLGCKTGLQDFGIISKQTCRKETLKLSKKVIFISILLFYLLC